MSEPGVRIERDGDVLRVTLCRPEARNAQTPATWRALAGLASEALEGVRLVVLSGEGPSFSAGLDRRMLNPEGIEGETSLPSLAARSSQEIDDFIAEAQRGFTWARAIAPPVIAYVQGHAIGAGFQLALGADLVVAAPDAQFAMRETSLGLVPDLGGTAPLVRAVGYPRAFEICASGRLVDAPEALRLGLAQFVVEREAWPAHEAALLAGLRQLLPGAAADLKALLRGVDDIGAQLAAERRAQISRLRALADGGQP